MNLLGKGSFGQVFEGLASNLERFGGKTFRVAVKVGINPFQNKAK